MCLPTNNQAKATAINFLFADRQRGDWERERSRECARPTWNFCTKQRHDNDEMYAKSHEKIEIALSRRYVFWDTNDCQPAGLPSNRFIHLFSSYPLLLFCESDRSEQSIWRLFILWMFEECVEICLNLWWCAEIWRNAQSYVRLIHILDWLWMADNS